MSEPVVIKSLSFDEVLAQHTEKRRQLKEQFEAMSDEEKTAYIEKRRLDDIETEKLLKELRKGSGFMEIKL